MGMLQDINYGQEMPSEADIRLWTQGEDDKDNETVRVILEDAEEPENVEEDIEVRRHLYRIVTGHMDA